MSSYIRQNNGMPSENMAIDMRHTKLKASEAAILAGEIQKPSWQSTNEGIHERVSFEDAIWGFDLAGGSFYKTPLRVVGVKPDSRAEKAGIRPGDKLLRINDIDTSTLSIQEAHAIIIESGIHLKIAVTAPEDEEDAYFCYEDPFETGYDSEEERRKEEEKVKKRQVHAKVSSYWSLQWPWVSKRRIIYRESNCFMVPSKYEGKHRDKFTPQPMIRTQDDIVLENIESREQHLRGYDDGKTQDKSLKESVMTNGQGPTTNRHHENLTNGVEENMKETKLTNSVEANDNKNKGTENLLNDGEANVTENKGHENPTNGVEANARENKVSDPPVIFENENETVQEGSEAEELNVISDSVLEEESMQEEVLEEEEEVSELDSEEEEKSQIETSVATDNHDQVIKEVLQDHDISIDEENQILEDILSNGDTSEIMDER